MKPIFFSMLLSCIMISAFAQKVPPSKVPQPVIKSFNSAYPSVKAEWEKEKNAYEVNFTKSNKKMSCLLNAKGEIIETEREIEVLELPAAAREYIKRTYKTAAIKEAAKIITNTSIITYEAQVNKRDLMFDSNGKFLKS